MSFLKFLEANPERCYLMFGGKGGLGKTTLSAATAYYLAKNNKKVLIFSIDPQASLSDIFKQDLFGKGQIEIIPNLFAQEVDADLKISEFQEEIRNKIHSLYGLEEIPKEIEDYIKAASAEPAMEESAIFDAVVDIVLKGGYDYYIYDLVPLGHALYYLSMASIYDAWIEKITRLREEMRRYDRVIAKMKSEESIVEDQILNELHYIRDRIHTSSNIFTNSKKTAFFFVLTPQEMAIADTKTAYQLFSKFKVPIAGAVVNRLIPKELLSHSNLPTYLKSKILSQERPLEMIEKEFSGEILAYVPEFERDISGLEMIEEVAEALFKG